MNVETETNVPVNVQVGDTAQKQALDATVALTNTAVADRHGYVPAGYVRADGKPDPASAHGWRHSFARRTGSAFVSRGDQLLSLLLPGQPRARGRRPLLRHSATTRAAPTSPSCASRASPTTTAAACATTVATAPPGAPALTATTARIAARGWRRWGTPLQASTRRWRGWPHTRRERAGTLASTRRWRGGRRCTMAQRGGRESTPAWLARWQVFLARSVSGWVVHTSMWYTLPGDEAPPSRSTGHGTRGAECAFSGKASPQTYTRLPG